MKINEKVCNAATNETKMNQAEIRAEVIKTLKYYMVDYFHNANVQASVALKIEVLTELYEYILGDINCRLYLQEARMDQFCTSTEEKLAEFMANPQAQGDNRFMSACRAVDVFLKNRRLLRAEQVAAADAVAQAEYDAEYYEHEAHRFAGEAYAAAGAAALFDRVFLENYLDLFYKLEDNPALQANVAADLLSFVRDSPCIQPALRRPDNVDLFCGLDEVIELMNQSRAAEANPRYQAVSADLHAFMAEGQRLINERALQAELEKDLVPYLEGMASAADLATQAERARMLFKRLQEQPAIQDMLLTPVPIAEEWFNWMYSLIAVVKPQIAVSAEIQEFLDRGWRLHNLHNGCGCPERCFCKYDR